jgi:hypothetical protein
MSTSASHDARAADPRPAEQPPAQPQQIDPRGQRFAATLTAVVLAVALLVSPSALTLALIGFQLFVFAVGARLGPAATPYAWLYRTLVRPRLGPPAELEDSRPPRCAQAVGFVFALAAFTGYAVGAPLFGAVAAGLALGAAFLNAAFGFCLGCELYLLVKRATERRAPATS